MVRWSRFAGFSDFLGMARRSGQPRNATYDLFNYSALGCNCRPAGIVSSTRKSVNRLGRDSYGLVDTCVCPICYLTIGLDMNSICFSPFASRPSLYCSESDWFGFGPGSSFPTEQRLCDGIGMQASLSSQATHSELCSQGIFYCPEQWSKRSTLRETKQVNDG